MSTIPDAIQELVTDFVVTSFLFGDSSRQPAPDESLVESGVVDSTGVLELIEFLEAEFGIEVLEEETTPENLDSIERLCRFVETKQGPALETVSGSGASATG